MPTFNTLVTFSLKMRPVAKGRPRLGQRGNVYTPKKTHEAERAIALVAKSAMMGGSPSTRPIVLNIKAVFRIPKNTRKSLREEMMGAPHQSTPDKDNIEKLVSDALNGICYVDDKQIYDGSTTKVYGECDEIIIEVLEWIKK